MIIMPVPNLKVDSQHTSERGRVKIEQDYSTPMS